jgi:hypothetical protein
LILSRVEIVLREVELKRIDVSDCDAASGSESCEVFEAGPVLVDLPLRAGAESRFSLDIPPGTYTEIEFDIHKVGDDPADVVFLTSHPEFDDLSIRASGTFNGIAFLYESDLGVEQELDLIPPFVVEEGSGSSNITVLVEVGRWFRDRAGDVIDPTTANAAESDGIVESGGSLRRAALPHSRP